MILLTWEFWVSIITAASSIIALFLSMYQIRLSNRQQLFDRRLKTFLIANGLVHLYTESRLLLENKRENIPQFAIDKEFSSLTNNTYMEQQEEAIKHPLEQPYHKGFLKKREELCELATELKLIFKGTEAIWYSEFVSCYEITLFEMYQYQIVIDKIQKANNEKPTTLECLQEKLSEEKQRNELYLAMAHLKEAYAKLVDKKAEEKIKKQLVLK